MVATSRRECRIEDTRKHPEQVVERLHNLLTSGVQATPDPKRPGFYEINDGSQTFYIYDAAGSGKILLLATWPAEASRAATGQAA